MTESEQLKQNAEKEWLKQRNQELTAYMDGLHDKIRVAIKNMQNAIIVLIVAWMAMMIAGFSGVGWLHAVCFIAYLVAVGYMIWRDRQGAQAVAEFKGALNVLRILGLIDYDLDSLGSRHRRKVLSELVDMVKRWTTKKKEAQEKVYAPV